MKTYRDLIVWQKAIDLVVNLYKESELLPKEENYGLTSQIRRSIVSVPSNIAEGYGRNSTNDYLRILHIASGSLYEFQTQLTICNRLNYMSDKVYKSLYSLSFELEKMLSSLITKIKSSNRFK